MSERPTPETDSMVEASFHRINFPTAPVPAEFARKLERERNEAKKDLANEMKWHHQTHAELIQAQCKLLDIEYDKLKS